jgi:hypothetical protein
VSIPQVLEIAKEYRPRWNGLTGVIPTAIGNLLNLETMSLVDMVITILIS